ncbi:MAG: right-handed parallel beta-helix repeat-containing protein, partial [Candidatus Hodarchaeales archaeon]
MWKKKHQWLLIFRTSVIILAVSLGTGSLSALEGLSSNAKMVPFSERNEQNKNLVTPNQLRSTFKIGDHTHSAVTDTHYAKEAGEQAPQLNSPIESSAPVVSIIDRNYTTNSSVAQTDLKRVSSTPVPLGGSGLDFPYSGSGNWNISSETVVWNEEITLDGNLFIQNGGNLTLRNVTLKINSPSGQHYRIQVDSGCHLTIRGNSTVTAVNTADEWYLLAKAGSTLLLENSSFSYAGWAGGTNGDQSGLWINTAGARVINCTIQNNWVGLRLHQANNVLIASNTITDSRAFPSWGLRFEKSNQTIVHGNTFQYHTMGIVLVDSFDCILSNNTILNAQYGIDMSTWEADGNNTARGNVIRDIGVDGIILGMTANNTITGNNISLCWKSGISLNGSGTVIVADNIISDANQYGIIVDSFDCTLIRNTINNSGIYGINLVGWWYAADNNIISDNVVTHSSQYGLYLDNADNNVVKGNTFADSTSEGVYLDTNADFNRIYLNTIMDNGGMEASDNGNVNDFDQNGFGNYWGSAYFGSDSDGDGIGEAWYWLTNNIDRYPLVYPADQYWVVEDTSVVENEVFCFDGYLLIQPGGSLTLRNVRLSMNYTTDGQFRVELATGGSLTIEANSTLTAFNPSNAWYLKANPGSTLLLKDSTFSYAGWEDGTNGDHSGMWINTDGAQIINCTIQDNFYGFYLYQAENCLIANNTITNGAQDGIYLESSDSATLTNNIFADNGRNGVSFSSSDNGILKDNAITGNTANGISLNTTTGNCRIWGNILESNDGPNAYDNGTNNYWDVGAHGNWWDDYVGNDTDYDGCGDQSYSISGGSGAEDRYPLILRPNVDVTRPSVDAPLDIIYEASTFGHTITWQPNDERPAGYRIYRDDNQLVIRTWNGSAIKILVDGLPLGFHNYTLIIYDEAGNWAKDTVFVVVIDITPPTVIIQSPGNITFTVSSLIFNISGDALHYWYFIENMDTMNQSWADGVNRTLNDGVYTLHVFGNDSAGNEAHTWVMFTIDTTPPTVAIHHPLDTTYAIPTLYVTLSGDAVHYWYSLEGPSGHGNVSWTGSVQEINLIDGPYTLHAYGNDLAGNVAHMAVTFTVRRDQNILIEIADTIIGANNTIEVSSNITVNIGVWNETVLTIKQVATGP